MTELLADDRERLLIGPMLAVQQRLHAPLLVAVLDGVVSYLMAAGCPVSLSAIRSQKLPIWPCLAGDSADAEVWTEDGLRIL